MTGTTEAENATKRDETSPRTNLMRRPSSAAGPDATAALATMPLAIAHALEAALLATAPLATAPLTVTATEKVVDVNEGAVSSTPLVIPRCGTLARHDDDRR